MKRRQLLGIVGTAASGSLAVGSGAFNYASVERTVSVSVVDDDRAFLELDALEYAGHNGDATLRSVESGRKVFFQIPGTGPGKAAGEGVSTDSVYEFADLMRVTNRGSNPVELYSEYGGSAFTLLALLGDAGPLTASSRHALGVGESVEVGLYIDSGGTALDDYDEKLTIVAEATSG